MSSILGGFLGTIWTSATFDGAKTNRGIITRFAPSLDPGNLPARGTGERGLYDVLLGMRQPVFALDFEPNDEAWIASIQDGSVQSTFLFLWFPSLSKGLALENFAVNRLSLECNHGEKVKCSAEIWAGGGSGSDVGPVGIADYDDGAWGGAYGARVTTPLRWLDSIVSIGGPTETQWWSWRYEVMNNLQRLGNVENGSTRDLVPRHRDVTGLIVKDCEDFAEYGSIADVTSPMAKFNITITLDGIDMLNCDHCRWGRLETPSAPEDLIAKRFPFTATDLTTLTP
jgi:hypothetical protein